MERIIKLIGSPEEATQHYTDVGELVRCKDCKHRPITLDGEVLPRKVNGCPDEACPFVRADYYYNRQPEGDFFCAWGERK